MLLQHCQLFQQKAKTCGREPMAAGRLPEHECTDDSNALESRQPACGASSQEGCHPLAVARTRLLLSLCESESALQHTYLTLPSLRFRLARSLEFQSPASSWLVQETQSPLASWQCLFL